MLLHSLRDTHSPSKTGRTNRGVQAHHRCYPLRLADLRENIPEGVQPQGAPMIKRRTKPRPKALWVQIAGRKESRTPKRIRSMSKSRAKLVKLYSKLREIHLLEVSVCEACRSRAASEIHHKRGRVGELLNDRTHWISVCRVCHDLIHRCPKWAAEKGYLEPHSWNQKS